VCPCVYVSTGEMFAHLSAQWEIIPTH
jgi:hypothetical protein